MTLPKVGMEPIRRRQLIDATIGAIHEHGFADTTVSRISARAGVSTGIVHHYFRGKDDLLEATLRAIAAALRRDTTDRLARARSPRERIDAVIDSNLAPDRFTPEAVSAWLAFWSQVPTSAQLARIQRIIMQRVHSNLVHALRALVPGEQAQKIAAGLGILIDGLWLRAALSKELPDTEFALMLARDYLDRQLREFRHEEFA